MQRFACMPPSLGGKAQPGQLYARNAQRDPAAFSPADAPCATLTPHGEVAAQSPSSSNPSSQGLPMQTGQDIIDMNSRLVGQLAQLHAEIAMHRRNEAARACIGPQRMAHCMHRAHAVSP